MLAVAGTCVVLGISALDSAAALATTGGLGCAVVYAWTGRIPRDYRRAAAMVERAHPDLAQALETALEQQPGSGRYTFLQDRVFAEALQHARSHDWTSVPVERARLFPIVHSLAATAAVAICFAPLLLPRDEAGAIASVPRMIVTVTPGDTEVERGSVVVVTARFEGNVPSESTLVWSSADGGDQRMGMARSLSDPVFALTLPALANDTDYHVEYRGGSSEFFHIKVFDRPALLRADATLDYPDYTSLESRTLEDVRRLSAVEGTAITYDFSINKPVRRAVLRSAAGEEIELEPSSGDRTHLSARFPLTKTVRYALHLEDDAGRSNAWPDDFRLEALANRTPNLRIEFPRGDQRVSALEELALRAEASDDFGLLDYGIGFAVGADDPDYVSLKDGAASIWQAKFERVIALEERGVVPEDLLTWFAWARDHAPDGVERLTNSDLFFGEVRPFDEIFREQADGGQQQQGGSGGQQEDQLLETQRQISIAIWNMKQAPAPGEQFVKDVRTLVTAQERARNQLRALRARIDGERAKQAAVSADGHMERTVEALEFAAGSESPGTLEQAWRSSQGAYQALLRLAPPETRVAQMRGSQRGQGGNNRNQRQLNQLRFRSNDDAYETESEAQALNSEEEREQMQTISRLRELAQRQQDLNRRLQELQTALVAAQDEAERERIERELKRLEEEQRRMLTDLDEVRQRLDRRSTDPGSRQAREQLDRTREDMRRSGESLANGSVSEALASGTRAQEDLDRVRDELRRQSSSQFAEDMREARQAARELSEEQQAIRQALEELDGKAGRSLDDSETRDRIANRLEDNRERLESLLEVLRRVTEESEGPEPGLHEQLYDMLRQQGQGTTDEKLETASEFLRRGFVEQAREVQPGIQRELDQLRTSIDRAAESVLGDEASTLRFARNELEDLSRELQGDRPFDQPPTSGEGDRPADAPTSREPEGEPEDDGRQPSGRGRGDNPEMTADSGARGGRSGGGGGQAGLPQGDGGPAVGELAEALQSFINQGSDGSTGGGGGWSGPLTGGDFGEWSQRLRTVESILELPGARERISGARERAEELRQEFRRHGTPPQWSVVEEGIVAPLAEVRAWLRQELARRDDPTALQPVDRDPVPDAYGDAVKNYYESLGR